MEKVYLNQQLSKSLSELGNFIPKRCYDNIFDNISKIGVIFKDMEIKIMFCYVSVGNLKGVYTRHACYYLDGKAIDPTIATLYGDKLSEYNVNYIPFKIMTVDYYFTLLSKEYNTDLFRTFEHVELLKHKELEEHGVVLIG